MAFPNKLLAEHEKLVFDLRPHWIELLYPAFWTVVLAIAAGLAQKIARHHPTPQKVVLVVAIVLWIWLAVVPFLRWLYTNFVLTTDRLITRTGVLAKHSKEIPLERINDVTFNQSVIQRMVGAGTLVIESAGERGQETISHVRNPEQVQLAIYKETEQNSNRMTQPAEGAPGAPPVGTAAGASIPEQIEALARLKREGVISETEYEAKKAQLLSRM
ncbi:MAG TPA: PH domain-containing protein [Actinomycetota bacterium]|nr:PH domain-containing protein [Actinomycetota bacterium]